MRSFTYKNHTLYSNGPTLICGIINVTPDSFSDGGEYNSLEKAFARAHKFLKEGANMLDIGGESTRPSSTIVEIQEEIRRVVPVIRKIKEEMDVIISIDTWKAEVADAALAAGADIVNDITGFLGDPNMAQVVAKHNTGAILMFNPVLARPNLTSSKAFPRFCVKEPFTQEEIKAFENVDIHTLMHTYFDASIEKAFAAGLKKEQLMLDPGIGFGLTAKENIELIHKIDSIHDREYFAYLGVSRKRFIMRIVDELGYPSKLKTAEGRANSDLASSAFSAIAAYKGVEAIRVHTIKEHLFAARVAEAVRGYEKVENIDLKSY